MIAPPALAAANPALPDVDLEDEEWEDLEVEEIDPALENPLLGEHIVDYLVDQDGMAADFGPLLQKICFVVATMVVSVSSVLSIYKMAYPTFFSFFLVASLCEGITLLWAPMTWVAPLLALSLVSAVKLYDDDENMDEQLGPEDDDEEDESFMDRRRG